MAEESKKEVETQPTEESKKEAPSQAKEEPKKDATPESKVPLRKPQFTKVDDLSPASIGFNLIVKVGKIEPIMNRLNLDGTRLKISEALIGDKSASIILSLRNDQIDMVKEGNCLILRNAKIDMVNNGYMRVAIDRWGLIEEVEDKQEVIITQVNAQKNLSDVEYELVKDADNDNYGRGRGGRGRRGGRRGRGRGRRRGGRRY